MTHRKPTKASRGHWVKDPPGGVTKLTGGALVNCDALDFLRGVRPGAADVIFLDPPFNLGKVYGSAEAMDDRLDESTYEKYMVDILRAGADALAPGGSLFLYHIPRWAMRLSRTLDEHLQFVHWIAISMKNGFVRGRRLYPAHYALLHYSKGSPSVLNRPKIPPEVCRHCGDYVKDYGGYKSFVEDGVNLSDVWEDISPVRHSRYKHRGANELPLSIPLRILDICGRKGALLIDPFAGAGTALVAARLRGLRFLACDKEASNIVTIQDRLTTRKAVKSGENDSAETSDHSCGT